MQVDISLSWVVVVNVLFVCKAGLARSGTGATEAELKHASLWLQAHGKPSIYSASWKGLQEDLEMSQAKQSDKVLSWGSVGGGRGGRSCHSASL